MDKIPFYTASVLGILIFANKKLRISTKVIIYIAIAITGYIWSGFLKFGISIYNLDSTTEEIL